MQKVDMQDWKTQILVQMEGYNVMQSSTKVSRALYYANETPNSAATIPATNKKKP